jgi:site-specific DNA recombinase
MAYCIYLRKSRADLDAEARGEGETLARHQHTLLELASRMHLDIGHIYREIVSGDNIATRPQMQRLLADLSDGMWQGVLCMEVERLARGDTIDQGVVARTFKTAGARIITPVKTYDPANPIDEEFFEFALFMARREYKTLCRRMNAGRVASATEGHFVASIPSYGYKRVKLPGNAGWTLVEDPECAHIVRLIFELAAYGSPDSSNTPMGGNAISTLLNSRGYVTSRGNSWTQSAVLYIIRNPVYKGYIRWQRNKTRTILTPDGNITHKYYKNDAPIIAKGLHPSLVSDELWQLANDAVSAHAAPPKRHDKALQNPLSGLVYCSACGHALSRKRSGAMDGYQLMRCTTYGCPTKGAPLYAVEQAILDTLDSWSELCKALPATDTTRLPSTDDAELAALQSQLSTLDKQRSRLHDLLEQGIYDIPTFVSRSTELSSRIDTTTAAIAAIESRRRQPSAHDRILALRTQIDHVRASYASQPDAAHKNALLKSVISRVEYTKTQLTPTKRSPLDYITLTVYPK